MKNWHNGNTNHPLYSTWLGMIARCKYPSTISYANYGGRGVKVCARWQGEDGLFNFTLDMGPKPTPFHTLDRVDNDGDYEPGNCRWATRLEQSQNQRPRGDNSRNTSGIRGVHFDIYKQRWRGSVMRSGKRKYTSYYKTKDEAALARSAL